MSIKERDELAKVIERAYDLNPGMVTFELLAHATLAAGYRKPRTIRTHQERAELKPGAICMDLAGNAWKRGTGSWVGTGEDGPLYDEENLTLIVLHEGDIA